MEGGARLVAIVLKAGGWEMASPFVMLGAGAPVGREEGMVSVGVWKCGAGMPEAVGERGVIVVCVIA